MTKVIVSKLDRSYHAGDWHDRPLGWRVSGPGVEVQNFSTREHARVYAGIRKRVSNQWQAQREYAWFKF